MFDDVFKNKLPVYDKLINFGFNLKQDSYFYSVPIVDGEFNLNIFISSDAKIKTQVVDVSTGDEYTLHLDDGVSGAFVGKVRADFLRVLQSVAENCFETKIFKSDYADKIIRYIKQKYQSEVEYLWDKFPENAIARRQDNKKWYIALLTVKKNKIGLNGDDMVEIIDLRMPTREIEQLVDGKNYFPGYHMNKKHWVTICLDGSVELKNIFGHIDASYQLANPRAHHSSS